MLQQWEQLLLHHIHHRRSPRVSLLHPFLGILHGIGSRLVQHVIQVPLRQLHEVSHHAALASAEIFQCQPVRLQYLHGLLAIFPVPLLRLGHYAAHRAFVVVKEFLILKHFLHALPVLFEMLPEDIPSECLDLAYHVPVLAIRHVVVHIVHHHLLQLLVIGNGVHHVIYGLVHHLLRVQSHSQVGSQHQFLRQVPQYGLEECVYRLHPEVVVVVQQRCQHGPCAPPYLRCLKACLLHEHSQIALTLLQAVRKAIERREDTHLHLLCRLVRKCHCQDAVIAMGILQQQPDILHCKGKGLAAACACLIYCQRMHFC